MVKKTDKKLTTRQRQSQQIVREKVAHKRREERRKKIQFVAGAMLGAVLVGGGGLSWYTGALSRTVEHTISGAYQLTSRAGFSVKSLHIEGRNRTPMAEVMAAMAIKKNDPILAVSLSGVRDALQAIPTIREAAVERALPDGLYVRIVEREPVALWQHQGALSLVDDQGVIMNGLDMTPYRNLPLIVGEGAPKHVAELMNILKTAPEIAKEFASAIRVGDRRWNVRLRGDIEVKLPEQDVAQALLTLVKYTKEDDLLKRDIRVIDLRIPDRMFIKVAPELLTPPESGAKET